MRVLFENVKEYIYFIQIENMGPVKVGRAKHPYKRLSELQVACPYKLKMLYFFPGGIKSEDAIKWGLREDNIRGEWFWPTLRVLRAIEEEKIISEREGWDFKNYDPEKDFKDERLGAKL